ncbi:MAG: multidrug transporter MATE [Lachnospiraceae bacterium]|nr:multidrug transporter MATE [Lachnospiraceae bacterium]
MRQIVNIVLDILFIRVFQWGVAGAAVATVIAQYLSGAGIALYYFTKYPQLKVAKDNRRWDRQILKELTGLSALTCLQQSIMNFGILMVQGLVNSFGPMVMAAFAAAVKIDSFAYAPVQDFGNAFSTYVAQNYGARKIDRIRKGMKDAVLGAFLFCLIISVLVVGFGDRLMGLFLSEESVEVIAIGTGYLRIEGAFYFGIGLLFLFYGYYRAVHRPEISVLLTVISLGTRVVLAYALSSVEWIGVTGIWMSVPIGWILADLTGMWYYWKYRKDSLG